MQIYADEPIRISKVEGVSGLSILYVKPREKSLTTQTFYNDILFQVEPCFRNEYETVEFDFNGLASINPMVLPLLYTLGIELRKRGVCPILNIIPRLSDDDFSNISYFIEYSGFYELNKTYNHIHNNSEGCIFEIPYARGEIQRFDYIKVDYIEAKSTSSKIYKKLEQFMNVFIKKSFKSLIPEYFNRYFEYQNEVEEYVKSKFIEPLYQVALNSTVHSNAGCAVSISHIGKFNKLYVSLSDVGVGLYETLEPKRNLIAKDPTIKEDLKLSILKLYELSDSDSDFKEMYMIIIALILRMTRLNENDIEHSDYGLISVVNFILQNNGYFRIHSNDTRIVLSNRMSKYFCVRNILDLVEFLKHEDKNLYKHKYFQGVHIDFELDLNNMSEYFWEDTQKKIMERINAKEVM